jgi:hypothetical protein
MHIRADDRFSDTRTLARNPAYAHKDHRSRRTSVSGIPRHPGYVYHKPGSAFDGLTVHKPVAGQGHLTARLPGSDWQPKRGSKFDTPTEAARIALEEQQLALTAQRTKFSASDKAIARKWLETARSRISAREEAEERVTRRSRRKPPQSGSGGGGFSHLGDMHEFDSKDGDEEEVLRTPRGKSAKYHAKGRSDRWEVDSVSSELSDWPDSDDEDSWSIGKSSSVAMEVSPSPVRRRSMVQRLKLNLSSLVGGKPASVVPMGVGAGGISLDIDEPTELSDSQVRVITNKGERFVFTRQADGRITSTGEPNRITENFANKCFEYMEAYDSPPEKIGPNRTPMKQVVTSRAGTIIRHKKQNGLTVELPDRFVHPEKRVASSRHVTTTTLLGDTDGDHGFADPSEDEGQWFVVYVYDHKNSSIDTIKICESGSYVTSDSIMHSHHERTDLYQSMVRTALQYKEALRRSDTHPDTIQEHELALQMMCKENEMNILLKDGIGLSGVTPSHVLWTPPAPRVPLTRPADRPVTANPNEFIHVRYRKGNAESVPEGEVRRFYASGRVTSEDGQREYHKAKSRTEKLPNRGSIAGNALAYRNNYQSANEQLQEGCRRNAERLAIFCKKEGVDVLFEDRSITIPGVTPERSRRPHTPPLSAREPVRGQPAPPSKVHRFDLFDAPRISAPQTARGRRAAPPPQPHPKEGRTVTVYNMNPSSGPRTLRRVVLCESGRTYDPESGILSQPTLPGFVSDFVKNTHQAIADVDAEQPTSPSATWLIDVCQRQHMAVDWPKGLAPLEGVAASPETIQAAQRARVLEPLSTPRTPPAPPQYGPAHVLMPRVPRSITPSNPDRHPFIINEKGTLKTLSMTGTTAVIPYKPGVRPIPPQPIGTGLRGSNGQELVTIINQYRRHFSDRDPFQLTPEQLTTTQKRIEEICAPLGITITLPDFCLPIGRVVIPQKPRSGPPPAHTPRYFPILVHENGSPCLYQADGIVRENIPGGKELESTIPKDTRVEIVINADAYQRHFNKNPSVHRPLATDALERVTSRLEELCSTNNIQISLPAVCPKIGEVTRTTLPPRRMSAPPPRTRGGPPPGPPPKGPPRRIPPSITVEQRNPEAQGGKYVLFHGDGRMTTTNRTPIPLASNEEGSIRTICALAANLSNTDPAVRSNAAKRLTAMCSDPAWNFRIVRGGPQIEGVTSRPAPMRTPPPPQTARSSIEQPRRLPPKGPPKRSNNILIHEDGVPKLFTDTGDVIKTSDPESNADSNVEQSIRSEISRLTRTYRYHYTPGREGEGLSEEALEGTRQRLTELCTEHKVIITLPVFCKQIDGVTKAATVRATSQPPGRTSTPPTSTALPPPAQPRPKGMPPGPRPKGPPSPPPISVQLLNAAEYDGEKQGLYTPGKGLKCGEVIYNFDEGREKEWTLLHRRTGQLRAHCSDRSPTDLGEGLDAHLAAIRKLCLERQCLLHLEAEIKTKLTREQLEGIVAEHSHVASLEIERLSATATRKQEREGTLPSVHNHHGKPPLYPSRHRPLNPGRHRC